MLVAALGVSWFAAVALALMDGRRRRIGWLAVAALGVSFVLLAVLTGLVLSGDPHQQVAGGWPAEVGIMLRADALGVLFALTSIGVLLAALAYEGSAPGCSPRSCCFSRPASRAFS